MERAASVFSTTFLAENVVVFDGGINCSTAVAPINPVPGWMKFGVVDGPLVVCEPMNSEKGLVYLGASDNQHDLFCC
jgi:hypothetical protein